MPLSHSFLLQTFIFVFENSKKSISCGPLWCLVWSAIKRHPEDSKNTYYVVPPSESENNKYKCSARSL